MVESKKFSELLEDAIKRYHNGMIDTVEFLEKVLIPFAEQIKEADSRISQRFGWHICIFSKRIKFIKFLLNQDLLNI